MIPVQAFIRYIVCNLNVKTDDAKGTRGWLMALNGRCTTEVEALFDCFLIIQQHVLRYVILYSQDTHHPALRSIPDAVTPPGLATLAIPHASSTPIPSLGLPLTTTSTSLIQALLSSH